MADNFGLKIGIEGEKEFKKALREINQDFTAKFKIKLIEKYLCRNLRIFHKEVLLCVCSIISLLNVKIKKPASIIANRLPIKFI